ncbi:MAG: histidinol-phosphatase [Oscillospiraceae bacterium]|nr:histidinol-phosphatase [Oscillospiraceae bacterium]
MIANYHTHTHRCNHAVGREEEYVQEALKAGLQILGWADHTPYIFPDGYYSHFRMRPAQLPGYIQTIQELRSKYPIEMPIGLETEYYPKHFPRLIEFLRDFPIDYLILGQHFIGNEYDAPYSGLVTDDRETVRQYCRQSMEAMNTGLFTYFAHPDLIHYNGDRKFYMDALRPVCAEAKSCGIPLEINLLGIREGRHYPNRSFWEVAAEADCDVILGCDAHSPQGLNDPKAEKEGLALAKEFGLTVLEKADLRSIHR